MKIVNYLSKEQKQQLNQIGKAEKKQHNTRKIKAVAAIPVKQEQLSRRDWEEIMGTSRDTYKRVRGAVRRK